MRLGSDALTDPARALLNEEFGNMLNCIRCGQCLTSCPTYVLSGQEVEGPRGRIALARGLAEKELPLSLAVVQHEQNCLVCDACTAVCPAGVQMDPLQIKLRAAIEPMLRRPIWQRMLRHVAFNWLLGSPSGLRRLVRLLALYQRSGLQSLVRASRLLKLLGLAEAERLLPPVDWQMLVPRGERYPAATPAATATPASSTAPAPPTPAETALFAGCVMATALANIDRATIRVLQRAGCAVVNTAGQVCCGALHAHSGDLAGLQRLARQNISAFESQGAAPIIVNSAGCGAMLKGYGHELAGDPEWAERARAFSGRVRDLTEYLVTRPLPLSRPCEATVVFQDPCHLLHAQRIKEQPRTLLRAIPGLKLAEMTEASLCCGSAGIYNLTNPVQSRQLQRRKLDRALSTGATIIVTANPGCLLQLRSGLAERGSVVQVKHLAELLDEVSQP